MNNTNLDSMPLEIKLQICEYLLPHGIGWDSQFVIEREYPDLCKSCFLSTSGDDFSDDDYKADPGVRPDSCSSSASEDDDAEDYQTTPEELPE
ncbi:hypothetical protein MMC18_003595, partial [Xylographa bjoerkii]|nr:hypothetical protein [Xylographa bjoerkii]